MQVVVRPGSLILYYLPVYEEIREDHAMDIHDIFNQRLWPHCHFVIRANRGL